MVANNIVPYISLDKKMTRNYYNYYESRDLRLLHEYFRIYNKKINQNKINFSYFIYDLS